MGKPFSIDAWTIYLWEQGDEVHGAAPVVTRDGIKEIYRSARTLAVDPSKKKNERRHQLFRAKAQVKLQLQNTLNALNWYGKQILDWDGNIDLKKFKDMEVKAAVTASGIHIDISQAKPIKKFPTKDINFEKAVEYRLI